MEQKEINDLPHPHNLINSVFGNIHSYIDEDQFECFVVLGILCRLRMEDIGYHFTFNTRHFSCTFILPYNEVSIPFSNYYLRLKLLSIFQELLFKELNIQRKGNEEC